MSSAVKTAINAVIKPNGRQEITGEVLNRILISMVDDYDSHILDAGSGIVIEEGLIGIDFGIVLDKETAEETYQTLLSAGYGIDAEALSTGVVRLETAFDIPNFDINSEGSVKFYSNDGEIALTAYNNGIIGLRVRNEEEEVTASLVFNDDGTIETTGEWDFDHVPTIKKGSSWLLPALVYGVLHEGCVVIGTTDGNVKCSGTPITDVIVNNGSYTAELNIGNEGGENLNIYSDGTISIKNGGVEGMEISEGVARFDSVPVVSTDDGDFHLAVESEGGSTISLAGRDSNGMLTDAGINIEIVTELPDAPDPNTLYFVKEA